VIAAGASSAPIVFDKPGTFAFFCEFHGGPGGTAMAGTIIVQ
jgi:plastocyanin